MGASRKRKNERKRRTAERVKAKRLKQAYTGLGVAIASGVAEGLKGEGPFTRGLRRLGEAT